MHRNALLFTVVVVVLVLALVVVIEINSRRQEAGPLPAATEVGQSGPPTTSSSATLSAKNAIAGLTSTPVSPGSAPASALPATATSTPTPLPSPTPFNPPPNGQSQGWNLVFHDEFDSSALDASKWNTCYWWGKDGCTIATNRELQWYQTANIALSNGSINLEARKQPANGPDGKQYPYTSGVITSGRETSSLSNPPRFAFQYGFAEIRARVPSGKGLLPAFWMLPASNKSIPEIDVMEVLGDSPNKVEMHYHYIDKTGEEINAGGEWTDGINFSEGWHTFAVDWEPEYIIWYVDGVERMRFTDSSYISDQPMYLLLNLAVGGNWPGDPDGSTVFPSTYQIDYVRVWQRSGQVLLSATEDTFVDASNPDTNYATSNTLHSDGDPIKISYIKFDTSKLAGQQIESAFLLLQTTTENGAGSPDKHGVFLVADSSWQEDAVTYNHRPEVSDIQLGELDAPNQSNTIYQIPLNPGQMQGLMGKVFTLSIHSLTGNDGLYMFSKDSLFPGVQLVLKFASSASG